MVYILVNYFSQNSFPSAREKTPIVWWPFVAGSPQGEDGKLRGVVPLFGILQVVRFD